MHLTWVMLWSSVTHGMPKFNICWQCLFGWQKLICLSVKYEFAKATVTYLGKVVGKVDGRPVQAKVEAINNYPVPTSKTRADMVPWARRVLLQFLQQFLHCGGSVDSPPWKKHSFCLVSPLSS